MFPFWTRPQAISVVCEKLRINNALEFRPSFSRPEYNGRLLKIAAKAAILF